MKSFTEPFSGPASQTGRNGHTQKALLGALGVLALLIAGIQAMSLLHSEPDFQLKAFDEKAYAEGVAMCESFKEKYDYSVTSSRKNPRFVAGTKATLIRNATLIDGDGKISSGRNIVLENGVVVSTEYSLTAADYKKYDVWDAHGRYVSPGLVDMHSHAGVDSEPNFWGTSDTNEISNPITSQVRSIDGINPSDEMFRRIMSGGVTTSLILPGSANVIGGEAFAVKHRQVSSLLVEDMLVQAGVSSKRQRWIKMACGENPKRVYPHQTNTRLGEAWAFRHRFDEARILMKKQDHWCAKAAAGVQFVAGESFPSDLEVETVVGVLRGDVRIHNHCYETMDLEMQVRNSHEFDFEIAAFHHALDAYRVPDLLRENNITAATFASHWGYKKEAFQGSVHAGKILVDNGVALAYKSDHPVTNSQNLIYQAQVGFHYGVPAEYAFASVTSVPATSLRLHNRVGYLRAGYDADVLMWNDHPLALGAYPLQVWVDGAHQFEISSKSVAMNGDAVVQAPPKAPVDSVSAALAQCIEGATSLVIRGVTKSFLNSTGDVTPNTNGESVMAVISEGNVLCYGSESECDEASTAAITNNNAAVFNLQDAHLVPGVTTLAPQLGLAEITSEPSTSDGPIDPSHPLDPYSVISAHDGLILGGPHLHRVHAQGVLDIIVAPTGKFLHGVSVAFKTSGKNILEPGAVTKRAVALHFGIGHDSKTEQVKSVSTQINTLRRLLLEASTGKSGNNTFYQAAANGSLPLVVDVDNKDEIGHLVLIKIEHLPKLNLIIHGGAEAYLVAEALANASVPVLLDHHRCQPSAYRSRHCLPGPPLTPHTNLQLLRDAGVKVGLVGSDDGTLGEQYWEAAWAAKLAGGYSEKETVELVSGDVRDILRLERDETSFVVTEGSPLGLEGRVVGTVDGGVVKRCWPQLP